MILPKRGLFSIAITIFILAVNSNVSTATNLPSPYDTDPPKVTTDTIPIVENNGDFINDPIKNPFDIVPSNVTQTVEYDAKSGNYILTEKIGDEYYRMPTYMTFKEYVDWREKEDQKKYFAKLGGVSVGKDKGTSLEDPMAQIDVANSLVDRLFGGTEVNIQPQGQVDVTMRSGATRTLPVLNRVNGSPWQIRAIDPDVGIRVSVDGKIGTKMNLNFNYDTQSTFDFDRKIKLEYDTEAFGEDDIIKKIEAGNVSLPLRSNLIQGAQSLFGLKTELQFGHLRLTALLSQQQSEQKSITIENGAAVTEFELSPDEFDENRHFFLSHFHRENFELALENLPQINSAFRIADIEVWISDNRPRNNNLETSTIIAGLTDLAENETNKYNNTNSTYQTYFGPSTGQDQDLQVEIVSLDGMTTKKDTLPDNRNNKIYSFIEENDDVEDEDQVKAILAARGMEAGDFASFQGRKLSSSEYSVNEQLGFISLNIRLRADQNLAVAYNYYYSQSCLQTAGEDEDEQATYQVGQLSVNNTTYATLPSDPNALVAQDSTTTQESSKVLFTKLLKSALQPTDKPSYDLMMKNVYPLRASQLDPQEFSFDIYYEDDRDGTLKKFLPLEELKFTPLLNLFNLDRLNKYNDPQPDGVFDFVPGVTIIPNSGTVVFPVLEPFGAGLGDLVEAELIRKGSTIAQAEQTATLVDSVYGFPLLYEGSLTQAKQNLEQNKFLMKGYVKSNGTGDINLGPFVPQGSVRVRAGGVELIEGADYEIDYSLGRLRIINDSYLQQGTPINVTFEDQTVFSLQQKNMMGLRADYNLSKKAAIGATMLKLSERPFTQKVNIGSDPISNVIYGADFSYSSEAPGLTKILDKLPLYSTKKASNINFYAEAAYLRPGYSSGIGLEIDSTGVTESVVSIDDFEGAINGVQLGGFNSNAWRLASTPSEFPEGKLTNNLTYGANRARLNWGSLDNAARAGDNTHAYTRFVDQTDIFDRDVQIGQSELVTFDLNYYPQERGPYNFDVPGGRDMLTAGVDVDASQAQGTVILNDPESRWAGIMRPFQNTDFEAANYEFIEFWMLNPYMDRPDNLQHKTGEEGKLVIHLGSVSEDILKDGSQMFENGLPTDPNSFEYRETTWGRTNSVTPFINGFDNTDGEAQDVGYDGLNSTLEREHYKNYLSEMQNNGLVLNSLVQDPSGDDFIDVEDISDTLSVLQRIKYLSNPEGNSPLNDSINSSNFRGNRFPDSEDMNNNRSLDGDLGEGYYAYEIPIFNDNGEVDTMAASKYITDIVRVQRTPGVEEKWYRVRIPISDHDRSTNISGYRSIQFMRMFVTGFATPKTFRLGEFQILRNLWRKNSLCVGDAQSFENFTVDEVGIQENSNRQPFNYVKHSDIKNERLQSTFANLLQDEKSMSLRFQQLDTNCIIGINKLAELDLTLYDKMQMFVHAEADFAATPDAEDDQLYAYIKIGKDLTNHYYEYEIPLKLSDEDLGSGAEPNVWPDSNIMTVPLKAFTEAKQIRIAEGDPLNDVFTRNLNTLPFPDFVNSNGIINIKGTPSLARIKIVEIGVKNKREDGESITGEVWMNELRLLGLNQKSALAGEARLQVILADLGDFNATASYSANGWGALDQRLAERNRKELINYDIATSLQLNKFFPESWGLSIPFYAQYSKETANLQFEPYEGDLTVEEKVNALEERIGNISNQEEIDSITTEIEDVKDRSKEQTTIKTFNFTNVKKNSSGAPKPWSPSNVSVSYAFTETVKSDPLIKEDKTTVHNTQLDYNYSKKASYIQPFKSIKSKHLKIIKEINFNPLPNSFTFGTNILRSTNSRLFRLPVEPEFYFDDKRFFWNRDYGLNWDLTKSLKFNFKAKAESIIDELRQVGIAENRDLRDWQNEKGDDAFPTGGVIDTAATVSEYKWDNLKDLGRSKNYNHNFSLTYNLPIRYLPYMDWVTAKADYKGSYSWNAGSLQVIDDVGNTLGNTIGNQNSKSINATFSFDKLYSKSKYLKAIDKGKKQSRRASRSKSKSKSDTVDGAKAAERSRKNKKKETGPSTAERILLRPLLALRNIKASYKEEVSTMLPGFMVGVEGSHSVWKGFKEPGFGFIAGGQQDLRDDPNNWLRQNSQWWNSSTKFNSLFSQTQKQTANLRIALEPIRNLDIDLEFKKSYTENYSDQFKFQEVKDDPSKSGFTQGFGIEAGSYNFTHLGGLNTLFRDAGELYVLFSSERKNISKELAYRDAVVDNNGKITTLHAEFEGYYEGYGPENTEVSVPAFLKAYTGRTNNPNESLLDQVSSRSFIPAPNWTVKYDGLSKLEMFKDVISSLSIRHGYTGTTTVGSFEQNILYQDGFNLSSNGNYQSEFNLPGLRIVDQFSPLIGFSLKLKNEMTFEAGMNKSRILNLTQLNLSESLNTEITFGFGYTIKNFRSGAKKKSKKRGKRGQEDEKEEDKDPLTGRQKRRGKVDRTRGKTLTLNLDVSYGDNSENLYNLGQSTPPQTVRGTTSLIINPNVDYDVNKNLTMRFFVNYMNTTNKTTLGVSTLDINAGVTAQLKIN